MVFLVERVQLNVLRVLVIARSFCSGPRIVAVGGPSCLCHRLCGREMQLAMRQNSPLSYFPSAGNAPPATRWGIAILRKWQLLEGLQLLQGKSMCGLRHLL